MRDDAVRVVVEGDADKLTRSQRKEQLSILDLEPIATNELQSSSIGLLHMATSTQCLLRRIPAALLMAQSLW
jgi:uncharacterized membrane-anchored protein